MLKVSVPLEVLAEMLAAPVLLGVRATLLVLLVLLEVPVAPATYPILYKVNKFIAGAIH